ncbi:sugar phosphate isomerase/epimerase family protein [Paenibacillus mendelii]|uniref:Sugar phosphate isomerase/epimerase family protein n=1 Tax=Paenibacillus mendelii TaxID=206163 RepID=A0ABV6J9Q4_9BACL|nr:sugar phosphate isomerase/epimerase [Paenibacillus mendelii]MCQ6561025.1 sugar phosphate isomerase/epimerase [Paenibacillus mendelii]
MKLGIIASPEAASFHQAHAKGLEFLEFCINIGSDIDAFLSSVPALKQASEQTGVQVASIGRWGTDRISKEGIVEEELQASFRLIDTAAELECPNFVCGVNYIEELSYYDNATLAIEYFRKLIEYGTPKGVQIAAYNCHWNNFVDNELAWTIIHGHLPELGIKFDPSHSRYAGRDYLKESRDWGSRFRHVHIKGSVIIDGQRFDDPPAGLDQTDWGTFMAILYGTGYSGGLSIEPHSHVWNGELGDKGVQFTIDYMRKFMF